MPGHAARFENLVASHLLKRQVLSAGARIGIEQVDPPAYLGDHHPLAPESLLDGPQALAVREPHLGAVCGALLLGLVRAGEGFGVVALEPPRRSQAEATGRTCLHGGPEGEAPRRSGVGSGHGEEERPAAGGWPHVPFHKWLDDRPWVTSWTARYVQLLGQPDPACAFPTFADACQVQAGTDAIYRSHHPGGTLVDVAQTA